MVRGLDRYANEIVQFSFKEILHQVEKKDKEQIQLKILILLELINYPLMARQIADILEVDELTVQSRIPTLLDYQCLSRVNQREQEKYVVNEEIRLLTRALAQEHNGLSQNIRQKTLSNFSIEKQLDYTADEYQIVSMFENYLSNKEFLEAEDFINKQLKERAKSVLINYHYARYLKERKRDFDRSISILENLRKIAGNHPTILRLLFSCYTSLNIPNYDQASVYVDQLERMVITDDELKLDIADFYIRWSTIIKTRHAPELDPLDEGIRRENYKNLARKGIGYLKSFENKTHRVYYLLAQGHFNLWDYDPAEEMIDKAISLALEQKDSSLSHYRNFKKIISEKRHFYHFPKR